MKVRFVLPILVASLGLMVQAKAANLVYLVGLRHVYSIPALPDPHELDRQNIEEDYSAAVADAQKKYDADMASIKDEEAKDSGNIHQEDRDQVQQNLEKDIAEAAEKREGALAEIYPVRDEVRESHPEFKVDQDGPYHVIEVQTAPTGEYSHVVYYRPYPLCEEVCPFGWAWGQPYAYGAFGMQIRLFHNTWLSIGAPVFAPMYYGGAVFIVEAPCRTEVIVSRRGWDSGRPPRITAGERSVIMRNHDTLRRSGYFDRGPGGRPLKEFKQLPAGARLSRTRNETAVTRTPAGTRPAGGARYGNRTTAPGGAPNTTSPANTTAGSRYGRTAPAGATGTPAGTTGSRYGRTGNSTTEAGAATGTSRYGRNGSTLPGGSATAGSRYGRSGSTTIPTGTTGSTGTTNPTGTTSPAGTTSTTTAGSRYGRTGATGTGSATAGSRYNRSGVGNSSSTATGSSTTQGSTDAAGTTIVGSGRTGAATGSSSRYNRTTTPPAGGTSSYAGSASSTRSSTTRSTPPGSSSSAGTDYSRTRSTSSSSSSRVGSSRGYTPSGSRGESSSSRTSSSSSSSSSHVSSPPPSRPTYTPPVSRPPAPPVSRPSTPPPALPKKKGN